MQHHSQTSATSETNIAATECIQHNAEVYTSRNRSFILSRCIIHRSIAIVMHPSNETHRQTLDQGLWAPLFDQRNYSWFYCCLYGVDSTVIWCWYRQWNDMQRGSEMSEARRWTDGDGVRVVIIANQPKVPLNTDSNMILFIYLFAKIDFRM